MSRAATEIGRRRSRGLKCRPEGRSRRGREVELGEPSRHEQDSGGVRHRASRRVGRAERVPPSKHIGWRDSLRSAHPTLTNTKLVGHGFGTTPPLTRGRRTLPGQERRPGRDQEPGGFRHVVRRPPAGERRLADHPLLPGGRRRVAPRRPDPSRRQGVDADLRGEAQAQAPGERHDRPLGRREQLARVPLPCPSRPGPSPSSRSSRALGPSSAGRRPGRASSWPRRRPPRAGRAWRRTGVSPRRPSRYPPRRRGARRRALPTDPRLHQPAGRRPPDLRGRPSSRRPGRRDDRTWPATSSALSFEARPWTMTSAPASASLRATARPIPEVEPSTAVLSPFIAGHRTSILQRWRATLGGTRASSSGSRHLSVWGS